MGPRRRQDESVKGLSGGFTVSPTDTSGPQLATDTHPISQAITAPPLAEGQSITLTSSMPASSSTVISSGSSSSGGHLTKVIVSVSTVLGVAVVALAVLLCWMRRRWRARPDSGQAARQARRAALNDRDAATVTTSVRARIGSVSDDSTLVSVGGNLGKETQASDNFPADGAPRPFSTTASSAPSLSQRLYAFFAGARTRAGSLSSGGDPPPAYEQHVLPEYGALP
ncbi:hypothetical protein VTO73DRAFT_9015 [Trametes versicolor]